MKTAISNKILHSVRFQFLSILSLHVCANHETIVLSQIFFKLTSAQFFSLLHVCTPMAQINQQKHSEKS